MFRSRLEARYAAYFDGRGWPWVYEPFDLPGYTPDFSVTIAGVDTLVEVKPATKLGQLGAPIARILRAGWRGPWMVVGADPDVALQGRGRHTTQRRYLGQEDRSAWASANNITQWKGAGEAVKATPSTCEHCGKQAHLLHYRACKRKKIT